MGLDKLTGRVKQAAGDLAGNEDLRRQGEQEERKGEAKQELAQADLRAESEEARAEARQDAADQEERQAGQGPLPRPRARAHPEGVEGPVPLRELLPVQRGHGRPAPGLPEAQVQVLGARGRVRARGDRSSTRRSSPWVWTS